jgi:general secretion pathway protein B
MSLILDALRKMEQERKAKRQGMAEIRAEVLRYQGNPHPVRRSPVLPVILVSIVILSFGAWIFFRGDGASGPETRTHTKSPVEETRAVRQPTPLPASAPAPLEQTNRRASVPKAPEPRKPEAQREEPPQRSGSEKIAISGIAWQEERSLRRVVINGLLLREGDEVAGAKIVEIRENLVRFEQGGRKFEVGHSSGQVR